MNVHPYYFSSEKRIFDIALGIFLLVFLLPLLVGISVVILITAGWPIVYVQKRVGKNKHYFNILKFRVMYVGADKHQWRYRDQNQAPEPMYKNWNDPRYVGCGRWLSRTGLDELPQLINIIRGDMSFVGPRPLPLKEAEQLSGDWDFRYAVKPGVFSDWSISAQRHLSLNEWLGLEKKTLAKGGLGYELSTIGKTSAIVLASLV